MQYTAPLSLNVFLVNAKGLNVPEKRTSFMTEAHRQRAQIIFFQETHFKFSAIQRLTNKRYPDAFHATCADSKTKGVAILFTKSLTFHLADQVIDLQGRFIFLKGTWNGRPVTLANVYSLNS